MGVDHRHFHPRVQPLLQGIDQGGVGLGVVEGVSLPVRVGKAPRGTRTAAGPRAALRRSAILRPISAISSRLVRTRVMFGLWTMCGRRRCSAVNDDKGPSTT